MQDILLLDVAPLSLGTDIKYEDDPKLYMDVLIPRNTQIPFEVTQKYSTLNDY